MINIPSDFIDEKERLYIKSLSPPLNTLPGGEGMSGFNHPRSKYTKEQLLAVADSLQFHIQ